MATPAKAITYLTTLETRAIPLLRPSPSNLRAMVERMRHQTPPLWRPLGMSLETRAPQLLQPRPLNLRAMAERMMTLFWRNLARRGWQIYPR